MKTMQLKTMQVLCTALLITVSLIFLQEGTCQNNYPGFNEITVNRGHISSVGNPDGIYNYQPHAHFDCGCWRRSDGKASIAQLDKANGGWYFFKNNSVCSTAHGGYGLIGYAKDCDPTALPFITRQLPRLIIPAYFFPKNKIESKTITMRRLSESGSTIEVDTTFKDSSMVFWQWLNEAAGEIGERLVVIANPTNGPGNRTSGSYKKALTALKAKGATIIGYVSVHNGQVGQAAIGREIDNWFKYYKGLFNGIFFDECHIYQKVGNGREFWPVSSSNYFPELYQLVESKFKNNHVNKKPMVVFNPGVVPGESYWKLESHKGQICPFEGDLPGFREKADRVTGLSRQQKQRSVIFMHSLPPDENWKQLADVFPRSGFYDLYLTTPGTPKDVDEEDLTNEFQFHFWNKLPPYFKELVSHIK
ncbi:MAG: spherulation-specific family 4 protein [Bacteroidota bacterium]